MATIISKTIRKLPPELREKYLAKKIRQRTALGWKEVHEEFSKSVVTAVGKGFVTPVLTKESNINCSTLPRSRI